MTFRWSHDNPVCQLVSLLQALRGEQEGRPVGNKRADDLPQARPTCRVEPSAGLVEEQHRGLGDQAGFEVQSAARPNRLRIPPE